jgi:3-hydroxybutyryl-CoA dehydratase
MSDIRKKTINGLTKGDTFSVTRTFTEQDVIAFGEISRDYNPIHFDRRFVETKGFSKEICHGLLVGGMLTEIGGQIGWLASGVNYKFNKPVYFGDTVTCRLTITKMNEKGNAKAKAEFINQDGTVVMQAELFGIIPVGKDKEVLKIMVEEGDPTNKLHPVL